MKCAAAIAKAILSLSMLTTATFGIANDLSADQLFEKISPSIWVVHTFEKGGRPLSRGSAVVISPGILITNCHVLARAASFMIRRENVSYEAKLQHADAERDLCQVEVRNFNAPAVEVVPTESLKVGQKVYAIGNPRGLELTLSDGLISGLRRDEDGKSIELVQTSAPISPGSSGGGLFDIKGRLVGVTTSGMRDAQNLNFAMPGSWIADVPLRSQTALARRNNPNYSGFVASGASADVEKRGVYYVGQEWEYAILDRMTNLKQSVILKVDRFEGDTVVFNGGQRTENMMGRVILSKQRILSELDSLNGIGGWVTSESSQQPKWTINTDIHMEPGSRFELTAQFSGAAKLTVPAGEFDTLVFNFTGTRDTLVRGSFNIRPILRATAWYSKQLNRIVKFSVYVPGTNTRIDEEIVLQKIR